LPLQFIRLTALEYLSLHGNRFALLPAEICCLTRLGTLELHSNRLTSLPPEVNNMQQDTLYLDGNPMT
ncbi:MAG: leucine-rich repeat domain-containing protein, partial [Alphaproteobacteria bacterium]